MEAGDHTRTELKQARERRGYTQEALATDCDCHATTISHIERGREQPSVELLAKLSFRLKVSPTRMLVMLKVWPPNSGSSLTQLHKKRVRRRRRQ
jgi:transcriptional regulator with XRE-family HTH domain